MFECVDHSNLTHRIYIFYIRYIQNVIFSLIYFDLFHNDSIKLTIEAKDIAPLVTTLRLCILCLKNTTFHTPSLACATHLPLCVWVFHYPLWHHSGLIRFQKHLADKVVSNVDFPTREIELILNQLQFDLRRAGEQVECYETDLSRGAELFVFRRWPWWWNL